MKIVSSRLNQTNEQTNISINLEPWAPVGANNLCMVNLSIVASST